MVNPQIKSKSDEIEQIGVALDEKYNNLIYSGNCSRESEKECKYL